MSLYTGIPISSYRVYKPQTSRKNVIFLIWCDLLSSRMINYSQSEGICSCLKRSFKATKNRFHCFRLLAYSTYTRGKQQAFFIPNAKGCSSLVLHSIASQSECSIPCPVPELVFDPWSYFLHLKVLWPGNFQDLPWQLLTFLHFLPIPELVLIFLLLFTL